MAENKPTAKIMDVVHPGNVQPAPSGRPVIVSNRPYIKADPMLNAPDTLPNNTSPANAPIEQNEKISVTDHDESDIANKQEVEIAAEQPEKIAVEPHTEKVIPVPSSAIESDDSTHKDEPEAPAEHSAPEDDTTLAANILKAQTPSAPAVDEDAEKAREEELERLIASKEYAVPINKVGRHKKIILLWVLVLLVLLIVMVDLLADMGVISLPFVPHTSFFSS